MVNAGRVSDETVAQPREGEEPAYVPDPRRWRILMVSLVIAFMALLDVTIVNVALPSIRAGLGTSNATVQWVVSGYALAFGLTLVAGGRLGDAYGRRRFMLIGLGGFILSSAAVGLAPNATWVIVARLVQGAAAGLLTPQNSGIVQQLFRGPERGRAFGFFGLTVGISSATGPILGGAIIALAGEENGWRWLFLVNVPIGLAAMVAIVLMVPKRRLDPGQPRARLDVFGALLLGAGVLALLFPLVSLEGGSSPVVVILVAAPVLLVAFFRWEARLTARGREPLLDVTLLRRLPGYASGLAIGAIYFTGFTGIFLVLSVHLQEELGFTPLQAGLLMTPFAIGAAVTAPIAGRLVSLIHRSLTVVALSIMMAGTLAVALLVPQHAATALWVVLVPSLLVAGLGAGGVIGPTFTLTLADVPPSMGGAAGGAIQTGQRIGSSIGAALLMTVYHVTADATSASRGLRTALLTAIGVLAVALAMAIRDLRVRR